MTPDRESFEAWYTASHTTAIVRRSAKGYIDKTTRVAWRAWQAAQKREPPLIEMEVGKFDCGFVITDDTERRFEVIGDSVKELKEQP